jgi:hypothetical protein
MESLMLRHVTKRDDEELSIYHGTSIKKTHVVLVNQGLLLQCYYPTREFEAPRLNEALCQFNYGNGRCSPFINKDDANRLINSLYGIVRRLNDGPQVQMGDRLKCGEVQITGNKMTFAMSGGTYRVYNVPPKLFIESLIASLTCFVKEHGEQYPFFTLNKYENGVDTNTMMLVTHHGDLSYDALPSYLRYIHSTNGRGGELTLQYGQLRLHMNEGHARGISWKHFLETLSKGLDNVAKAVESGSKGHTERLYEDHVVLGKYNFYVSMIKEYRGTFVVISSDLSCTNSKVSFVVEGDNLTQLKNFIKAVVIYLEKQND